MINDKDVRKKMVNGEIRFNVNDVAKKLKLIIKRQGRIYVEWRLVNNYLLLNESNRVRRNDYLTMGQVGILCYKVSKYNI